MKTINNFIKAVLFFLAVATSAHCQKTWFRPEYGAGVPNFNPTSPAPKQSYYYIDSLTQREYMWVSGTIWKESYMFKGQKGDDGITPTFISGNTTTTAFGTLANVQVRIVSPNNYAIDATIPQGKDGTNGTGGAIAGQLSPDNFGAKHSSQTIAASDTSYYSSVGAKTSDTYDWAAWQMCMNDCDGKEIKKYGKYYWNRSVIKPPLAKCVITGGYTVIATTNNNTFSMLTTVMPADFAAAEARNGAGANFVFTDIRFEGTLNQIAFQPFATSDNYLRNVSTAGFKTGILLQFCLGGIYDNITCLNGTNGLLNSWGGYPNDTPIDNVRFPTSNGSKIRNYHAVNITNVGLANYGGYNVDLDIKAIEGQNGNKINRAIDVDDMGNTSCKNFFITGCDFEGITIASGTGNAFLHLKTVVGDSRTIITGTNMHTSGTFIYAEGANDPEIIVNVVNWIITKPCLVNFGYTWQFNHCSAFPFASAIAGQFSNTGTLVTACNPDSRGEPTYNAQGCGANHFNYSTGGK